MNTESKSARPWYEQIFDSIELTDSRPALERYSDFDKHPAWVVTVLRELVNQNMPAAPIKKFKEMSPAMVGGFLGQSCANVYAVGENLEPAIESVKRVNGAVKALRAINANAEACITASTVEAMTLLLKDSPNSGEQIKSKAVGAFKKALEQPNHKEASEFFHGFAKGFSVKGLTSSGAARRTSATPIYLIMFFYWPAVDQLPSVPALRKFLLTHGLSENQVGDISRLRRLCTRIGYAPGKRGRPANPGK